MKSEKATQILYVTIWMFFLVGILPETQRMFCLKVKKMELFGIG